MLELPPYTYSSVRRQQQEVDTPPPSRGRRTPVPDAAVAGLAEAIASLPYKITKVPSCDVTQNGIPGSVVYPVLRRSQWEAHTSELLALCHEAADRRANKTGVFRGIHHDHAEAERMSLVYICIYMCICVRIYIQISTYMHAYAFEYKQTLAHIYTHI